jgi:5-(carboxyamino)imidazole ribonucleotide synthase
MVGAGQLARMTLQAAVGLDVELTVLAVDPDEPAVAAGARHRLGDAGDRGALAALAAATDVVTFDHELVPLDALAELARAGHAIRPAPEAKALAQDKLHARRVLRDLGFPVPAFAAATTTGEITAFARDAGWPVVVKAQRGGYDGRGVHVARDAAEAGRALAACGGAAVVEEHVAIATELAALVARRPSGDAVAYPVVETVQSDGMLRALVAPAPVADATSAEAAALALALAERVDAAGLVAVELFLTTGGALLVNELALRPHNSGHWTIEGAETSQFEQHLRAILDWPLGATTLRAPAVATVNVVGRGDADPADSLPAALAVPGAHVHLYGKRPRDGRKLGHVTALGPDAATAQGVAQEAAARLEAQG